MGEDAARLQRAATLFNVNVNTTGPTPNTELKQLMWKLEKLKNTKKRGWWDAATLKTYVEKAIIPRGLRINKAPTAPHPEMFMTTWNSILTDCSIKLMKLIIQHEEITITTVNSEIVELHEQIKEFENTVAFQTLNEKINTNMQKLEDHITDMKKVKFNRDVTDYQKKQIYSWKAATDRRYKPRPILKYDTPRPLQYQRSTPRTVSFSERNAPADMSHGSDMDYQVNSSLDMSRGKSDYYSEPRNDIPYNSSWNHQERNQPPKNWERGARERGGRGRGRGRRAPPNPSYNIYTRSRY